MYLYIPLSHDNRTSTPPPGSYAWLLIEVSPLPWDHSLLLHALHWGQQVVEQFNCAERPWCVTTHCIVHGPCVLILSPPGQFGVQSTTLGPCQPTYTQYRLLVSLYWLLVSQYWLLVSQYRLLVSLYWLLVSQYWLLPTQLQLLATTVH